LFRKIKEISTN